MSKVIKGSPFDLAGYTEETKFKVIKDIWIFKEGDILTLHRDDGTRTPLLTAEDGRLDFVLLPRYGMDRLEVYEEPSTEEYKEAIEELREGIKTVHKNKESFIIPAVEPCVSPVKLSLLARIILSESNLYNGHSQVTINSKLTLDDLTELMTELNEYFEDGGSDSYVEARFDVDGSGSLYAVGYWGKGEHQAGHTDKLLFSWGDV